MLIALNLNFLNHREESHMVSHLSAEQLSDLSGHTISHYEQNATSFWEGTKDHDVTQNIDCLKRNILTNSPHRILDLGCGPGRDLLAFKEMGDEAIGLDGCALFVKWRVTIPDAIFGIRIFSSWIYLLGTLMGFSPMRFYFTSPHRKSYAF